MEETNLLKRVRATCQEVAQRARHVRIAHERIQAYAAALDLDQAATPQLDPASHYLGHGDDTAAFILTLDAINFGSGYFPHLRKRPGRSGYFTIASSLNDYYKEHGPIPARELAELAVRDCARIFDQDDRDGSVHELMQLFAKALNQLGRYLLDRFEGSFIGLIESAGFSAERLVRLLIEMPYFNDVEPYHGLEVAFYKRAQLAAADLWLAFEGQGLGRFDDLDHLTIFADNLVPHVLRVDGLLVYEESLAAKIDAGELIPAFSPEEIEIRACAVHAVELLVGEMRRAGYSVNSAKLDYLLWNRGQQPSYKARPRHRTRTVFY
jgi:hypothetical protein